MAMLLRFLSAKPFSPWSGKRNFMNFFKSNPELSPSDISKQCAPSVVTIYRKVVNTKNREELRVGLGSGIIWKAESNIIVTCFHVIENAFGKIRVVLYDHTWHDAVLVNADPIQDIAVLRIMGQNLGLIPIKVGKAANLKVGEKVYAVGDPLGTGYSFSEGTISGLNLSRSFGNGQIVRDLILTDCAVKPGNSGSPFVDGMGRCIGMFMRGIVSSDSVGLDGYGPSVDTVSKVVDLLLKLKGPLYVIKRTSRRRRYFGGRPPHKPDKGTTVVDNLLSSDDIHYMLGALKTLGLHVEEDSANQRAVVEGCGGIFPVGKESKEEIQLFLGNAGTAMQPLTAEVTVAGGNSRYVLDGVPRMKERPIGDLVDGLKQLGAEVDCFLGTKCPPVRIVSKGGLPGGKVKFSGSISSQYLTALLMAAPLALGNVEIEIIDKLISVPYVEMTLKLMERYGISVEHSSSWDRFFVRGGQKYKSPGKVFVEGDASSASYFLAGAAVTGGTITVEGCGTSSLQVLLRLFEPGAGLHSEFYCYLSV